MAHRSVGHPGGRKSRCRRMEYRPNCRSGAGRHLGGPHSRAM